MKRLNLLLLFGLLHLVSCKKDNMPIVEYRLTSEQMAWQPYRTGDVLRFGNDQNSRIRTYQITEIDDKLEKRSTGSVYIPIPFTGRQTAVLVQRIAVRAQRSDSTTAQILLLSLELAYNPDRQAAGLLFSDVSWEGFYGATLPIDSVNAGKSIDQRFHPGLSLLPTLPLGPTTYQQVLVAENRYLKFTPPGIRPVSLLYYARQRGVVGFVESGILWYKLP